jgi:hypothetical protein
MIHESTDWGEKGISYPVVIAASFVCDEKK